MRKYWGQKQKEHAASWQLRLVPGTHRLVGMVFSWFLFRWLEWHLLLWIPSELHVAHALAAFVAIIGAILGIWILNFFGDKLRDYNKRSDEHQAQIFP